jgi:hypothetical protein
MLKLILLISGLGAAGVAGAGALGGDTSCPTTCPLDVDCPPDCGDTCTLTCTRPDGTTCAVTLQREGDRCVVVSCAPAAAEPAAPASAKAEACPPGCCSTQR